MDGSARELWVARWSVFRQWAGGALKAFAIIALWALVIWIAVLAIHGSGLLKPVAS